MQFRTNEPDVIFKFGLIGDTQYVDDVDGSNFDRSVVRRYRQSFKILEEAASMFKWTGVEFSILLGDVLDTKSKKIGEEEKCFAQILTTTRESSHPWHFLLGNHDFTCFDRPALYQRYVLELHAESVHDIISQCSAERLYYSFCPMPGYRFVFLDGFEVSTIGALSPDLQQRAWDIIRENNPNFRTDPAVAGGWFEGLEPHQKKFCPFNGAIGDDQLVWLKAQLADADAKGEVCFVSCHEPVYGPCCDLANLLFNNEEVLEVIQKSRSVVAFFAGHDHRGGYAVDPFGIHHVVPPAPLECDEGQVAYGFMEVKADHMDLVWTGKAPDWNGVPWPSTLPFSRSIRS